MIASYYSITKKILFWKVDPLFFPKDHSIMPAQTGQEEIWLQTLQPLTAIFEQKKTVLFPKAGQQDR